MADKTVAELVDCLRYRPVATNASQMRQAADLIERMTKVLHGCAWMALDAEDPVARQKQDNARELLRECFDTSQEGSPK